MSKWTPGPWAWMGSTHLAGSFYLATVHHGRRFVMGFKRRGFNSVEPTFQVNSRMVPASELVLYDVDSSIKGKSAAKLAPSVYREDFSVIDHPDARLIAAAPELYDALDETTQALAAWSEGPYVREATTAVLKRARAILAKARGETAREFAERRSKHG